MFQLPIPVKEIAKLCLLRQDVLVLRYKHGEKPFADTIAYFRSELRQHGFNGLLLVMPEDWSLCSMSLADTKKLHEDLSDFLVRV